MRQAPSRPSTDAQPRVLKLFPTCHSCGSTDLEPVAGYESMPRVTSDCRPWKAGGKLAHCRSCDLVQTVVDDLWQEDAEQIYREYQIYHQSNGAEQAVFVPQEGVALSRSHTIVESLVRHERLPESGRWLDVGCGNGATLIACSRILSQWRLNGTEVHDVDRRPLEALPGFESLTIGADAELPGRFDVISLIHVIEHVPAPAEFLRRYREQLTPGGLLVLQVPDCEQNPYILMVADHCSHFTVGSLAAAVEKAGFRCLHAVNSWVTKEVTIVACRDDAPPEEQVIDEPKAERATSDAVLDNWQIVRRTVAEVSRLAKQRPYGIFGTAVAATWLDAAVGGSAQFFADEDPHRVGKQLYDRPVVAPTDLPENAVVYMALPEKIARRVVARLAAARPDVDFVLPSQPAVRESAPQRRAA